MVSTANHTLKNSGTTFQLKQDLQAASDFLDDGKPVLAKQILEKLGLPTDGDLNRTISDRLRELNGSDRKTVLASQAGEIQLGTPHRNIGGITRTAEIATTHPPFLGLGSTLQKKLLNELAQLNIRDSNFSVGALDGLFLDACYVQNNQRDNPIAHGIQAAYFSTMRDPPLMLTIDIRKKIRPFQHPTGSQGIFDLNDPNFSITLGIYNPSANQLIGEFRVDPKFSIEDCNDLHTALPLRTPSEQAYSFAPGVSMSLLQHAGHGKLDEKHLPLSVCQMVENAFEQNGWERALAGVRYLGHLVGNVPGGEHMLTVFKALRLEQDFKNLILSGDISSLIESASRSSNLGDFLYQKQSVHAKAAGFRGASR